MERWEEIKALLKPVTAAPPLHRVNGIGVALLGRKREIPGSVMYFKGYWVSVLFIPIVPICFYLVSGGYPEYRFHARLSILGFVRLYKWSTIFYLFSAFFDGFAFLVLFGGLIVLVSGGIHYLRQLIQ